MKDVKVLERRIEELNDLLGTMETELFLANMGGCKGLLSEEFWEEYDRTQEELQDFSIELEAIYDENPDLVSEEFRLWIEEARKIEEEQEELEIPFL